MNQNFYLSIFKTSSSCATEDAAKDENDVECIDGEKNITYDEEF